MKIRTAIGPLALAWAATFSLSLLPGAAQTPKSSQHDQASDAPVFATLQKDLKEELKGQEDECLPLKDHVDILRFDLGPTRETWHLEGHYPCFGGNDISRRQGLA